jgi:hypothetical protein
MRKCRALETDSMDADLHAVLGIAKLDHRMRTKALIHAVLTTTFVSTHPALIRMLQAPNLDAGVVQSLVARLVQIRSGESDLDTASAAVGQTLVDTYITPVLTRHGDSD